MAWGRIDDGLYDHPKVDSLGKDRLPGIGLLTLSISWSNRRSTDGFIPHDRIRLLGGSRRLADRLVEVGLFEDHADGYLIHDFLDFNESADVVAERRQQAAERQRRHRSVTPDVTRDKERASRRESRVTDDDVTPVSQRESRPSTRAPAAARPVPTRPNPDPEIPPPPAERGRRSNGTNLRAAGSAPRQAGTNARANGTSTRQRRKAEKRGPTALGHVLRQTAQPKAAADDKPIEWMRPPSGATS